MTALSLKSSPHHHNQRDTGAVMRMVCYAAVPGILVQTWQFGFGVLIQLLLAIATAVITEAIIVEMRKKNTERAINDCSAILTGLLLAISIPPFAPWWVIVIGTFFSIAVVKQLYGGLGFNLFNPAMAGYVMLLISFPQQMTAWTPPYQIAEQSHSLVDAAYTIFTGFTATGFSITQLQIGIDGSTMATPLDAVKTGISQGYTVDEITQGVGFIGGYGQGWYLVSLAYLLGGLFLMSKQIISWHIPISMLLSAALVSLVLYASNSAIYASPLFHLLHGSLIVGAFFIATDPVSASTTNKGRIWFGALIGFWVIIIRTWGGYPDAIAFAVLIMNMAVPLIDYYTRPRTYGHGRGSSHG